MTTLQSTSNGRMYDMRAPHSQHCEQEQHNSPYTLLCWAQMMRREADQHLDVIGHSVRHLGEMATTINVELTEQDQ